MTPADTRNFLTGGINFITDQPILALLAVMVVFFILWLIFKDVLSMDDLSWEIMTSFVIIFVFFILWLMMDKGVIKFDIIGIMKSGIKSLAASI